MHDKIMMFGTHAGVDAAYFRCWYTDFGQTNLGVPKSNRKEN